MKKQIIMASILAFLHSGANAQIKVDGISSPNITGSSIGGTNIIVGNGSTSGTNNTYIGSGTATTSTTGSSNTYIGQGVAPSNNGSANTFVGRRSGEVNQGSYNVFLGENTGLANNTGLHNTFLGTRSGVFNTEGKENTFVGLGSGYENLTGNYNTILGTWANFDGIDKDKLHHAVAIGYNARVSKNNSMSLGALGTTNESVLVGIGTGSPDADLHISKYPASGNNGTSILSHWANTNNQSSLYLRTGTTTTNDLFLKMYGSATTGTLLSGGLTGGPGAATTSANIGLIATKSSPLMIGLDPTAESKISENIYFVNNVAAPSTLTPWECIRINKDNGFVGIHTRTASSGAGTGQPQALFHVNLTNSAKVTPPYPGLDVLTEGIRFEGLGDGNTPNFPDVLVIDPTGNIAKRDISTLPGGGTIDWHTNGNSVTIPVTTEFIGTTNNGHFNIKTNGLLRGKVTNDGNFDFGGTNTFSTSPFGKSTAMGDQNSLSSDNSVAAGKNNIINVLSDYSGAIGYLNQITNTSANLSSSNFIAGKSNVISVTASTTGLGSNMILGGGCAINNSHESVILGEGNQIVNGHGSMSLGGHNISNGEYNFAIGSWLNTSSTGTDAYVHAYGYNISNDLNKSIVMGFNQRTTVINQTGLAVQLAPTSTSTYVPTVNFEVQAGVPSSGSTAPLPLIGGVRSNVRFHNLPRTEDPLPVVMIDPATGELFMSEIDYPNPPTIVVNDSNQSMMISELKKTVEEQKVQIANQQKQIDALVSAVKTLTETKHAESLATINVELNDQDAIVLQQNIPNPCDKNTSIGFSIPASVQRATLNFTTVDGKIIKSITISERGKGLVNIYTSDLKSGIYIYSLVADGSLIDSKRMEINR